MIELNGLEAIEKKLTKIADIQNTEKAMAKACALVERAAKENAPVSTGELRRSITSEVQSGADDIEGVVFTPLEYAPYLEYGTGLFAEEQGRSEVPWSYQDDKGDWHTTCGIHPQPFMRPALDQNREEVLQIIKEGLLND